jgi:hypothetical protein
MPTPPVSSEDIARTVEVRKRHATNVDAGRELGVDEKTVRRHMVLAAERGLLGPEETKPGYVLKSIASKAPDGSWTKQVKEAGPEFKPTDGLAINGKTTWTNAEGRITQQVTMERKDAKAQLEIMRAAVAGFKDEIPRAAPITRPSWPLAIYPQSRAPNESLLNQFTVTDSHFGMLSWREETGSDYDLRIAEELLLDWFSAAIANSPDAHTALFAQLGDLMHHDALESVTPAHRHVLDADSRLQKVIRIVIKTIRRAIDMLLHKHEHVHCVMASGNHDPASSAWLREMLAAMYENEPRVSVDNSPSLYYAYRWGYTGLFYHHGHKRDINTVDATLAGLFREIFGACRICYAHVGHKHSDEGKKTNLMYVERHETLAAPDAFNAGGGWLSGRSAKVITYSRHGGEVFRSTLRPEMVAGSYVAANDNEPVRRAA